MTRRGHDASFDYHRRMIEDVHRMDAYERALRARVRPGDVVLDLGCGTGILAMMAARCGAARVHAVESMPVARVARQLVAANGLEGRVVVHEADATELPPVEPVDLVVGDFMGRFVVDDAMLDAVAAAGAWLRPGGGFLPSRLRLWVAPAGGFRMPSLDWVDATAYGLDLRPMTSHVLHQSYGGDFHESLLLATAQTYAEIVPPHAPPFDAELAFAVERAGMLRGLVGWFEAELAPGITLSTAPDVETHWGQVLFPLTPVAVLPGDLLEVSLRLVAGDAPETEWSARLRRGAEVLLDERLDTRDLPGERPAPAVPIEEGDAEELNERGAEAYHAGRPDEALRLWEQATRALRGSGGEWGPRIYENLGIAYLAASQPLPAARAFMRALDGDLSSREQSLRLLIRALEAAGKMTDAAGLKAIYDARFTP